MPARAKEKTSNRSAAPRAKKPKVRKPGEPCYDPVREAYASQRAMGYSQRAAFTRANPKAKGMKQGSIDTLAAVMEAEPDVQARRREIQAEILAHDDAICSKKEIARLLSDALRTAATDPELMSTAAGIADKLNKMFGYYEPEKHDVQVGCLDQTSADAKIAALLKLKLKKPQ